MKTTDDKDILSALSQLHPASPQPTEEEPSDAEVALANVVSAWEATKPGQTTRDEIQRWLVEDMKPAIDAARALLAAKSKGGEADG